MTLTLCGDRELWLVRGAITKKEWVLPIYCDPFDGEVDGQKRRYYRIEPTMKLTSPMEMALTGRLTPHIIRSDAGFSLLTETSLNEIAHKAPGITPGYYIVWPNYQPEPQGEVAEKDFVDPDHDNPPQATEKFLEWVFQQTQVAPLPTIKLVWRALMQHLFIWMVEKHKSVDLGFLELLPTPYRSNWTQVMKAMFPNSPYHANMRDKEKRDLTLMETLFSPNLTNSILYGLTYNTATILWRIDVIHKKIWWAASQELEEKEKMARGPVGYTEYVVRRTAKMKDKLIEVYANWAKEANRPAGGTDEGITYGVPVLTCWIPEGRVTAIAPPEGDVEAVVDAEGTRLRGPGNKASVAKEVTKRLLQMSAIQSKT